MSQYSEQVAKVVTPDLLWLRARFQEHGYDIRIVGGAVRDLMLGLKPNDVDFCTDASQKEQFELYQKLAAEFPEFLYIATGVDHGTYTVIPTRLGEGYEITSLRTESQHDGRHAVVAYTKDWVEDLSRRDLTINAMALTFEGVLDDPFGGLYDLRNNMVRFVGNAEERMTEDYLRILRYFRFLGRFSTESATAKDIPARELLNCVEGLAKISSERVWAELAKIVAHPSAPWVTKFMGYSAVFEVLGLENPTDHFDELKSQGCTDPVLLMVSMLPKPVQRTDVEALAKKLKWSNDERKVGLEISRYPKAPEMIDLQFALAVEGRDRWVTSLVSEFWCNQQQVRDILNYGYPGFPVCGDDLKARGMSPGREMGLKLSSLKITWFKSACTMSKEELLKTLL